MRLKPEKIEELAEKAYESLASRAEVKLLAERSDVVFEISQTIAEDLETEDEIERDARALLEKHARELRLSGVGSEQALRKTMQKIARERKFVL